MRGVREPLEKVAHALVHGGARSNAAAELRKVFRGGQLAVDDEVGGLEKDGLVGQIFDAVTAVAKDALLAIDERDVAAAGTGVGKTVIVGDVTGLIAQRAHIDGMLVLRTDHDGQLDLRPARQGEFGFVGVGGRGAQNRGSLTSTDRSGKQKAARRRIFPFKRPNRQQRCACPPRPGRRDERRRRCRSSAGCGPIRRARGSGATSGDTRDEHSGR